ncbi:probable glutamate receptor [Scylla paramamosain]|uniref:probable glutamate receptor n=1 Tax=Scylla paramamosain TaxID=85552 RepID=UPI003082A6A3
MIDCGFNDVRGRSNGLAQQHSTAIPRSQNGAHTTLHFSQKKAGNDSCCGGGGEEGSAGRGRGSLSEFTKIASQGAEAMGYGSKGLLYEIREEPNRTWGLESNGVHTGMMGQLQREEADFCTIAAPTPQRLAVVDYMRGYPSDYMTVISLKPSILPQHMALIRPFSEIVWIGVLTCVFMLGFTMWLLQKLFRWFVHGSNVPLHRTVMYSWGALLEQPPSDPSISVSGQLLVGWWLMFCLIVSTGFRSSLIAHLTVQGKTQPPKTMKDLVEADNWKWSTEPWLLKGVPHEYFSRHPDPVVQKIYEEMELLSTEEAVKRVMKGRFAMIIYENYMAPIIATRYTDSLGRTPFYISKESFPIMAAFGWGFRKGAPFFRRMNQMLNSLRDAGIITYWTKEVIAQRIREEREKRRTETYDILTDFQKEDDSVIALGIQHLQGAFILLGIGSVVAMLSFIVEFIAVSLQNP